jgi:hypothetical protein
MAGNDASASGVNQVLTKSRRKSATSMPKAEKWPGARGTTTLAMRNSRATIAACKGPAPP